MKNRQVAGFCVLVILGGILWWAVPDPEPWDTQTYFILVAITGFVAGLAVIEPWWTALALGAVPTAITMYQVLTAGSKFGPIGPMIGFGFIAGTAAVFCFLGRLAGSRKFRHQIARALFGSKRLLILAGFLLLPASGFAQTYYYQHGFSMMTDAEPLELRAPAFCDR